MKMTSKSDDHKGEACFTIIWALENYNELPFHLLITPWFSSDILDNTQWTLNLIDGDNATSPMSCTIFRGYGGRKRKIDVSFEVAILDICGEPIVKKSGKKCFEEFTKSESLELIDKISILELKEKFLPNDILTLRCHLWVRNSPNSKSDICFIRTVLGLEKREFFWTNKEFSHLQPGQKRSLLIEPHQRGVPTTKLLLYLTQTEGNEGVDIEVNLSDRKKLYGVIAKFSIVEANGKISYTRGKGRSIILKNSSLKFEPFIQKSVLDMEENGYIHNDTLFLLCELKISYEEVLSQIENYGYGLATILRFNECSTDFEKTNATSNTLTSWNSDDGKSLERLCSDSKSCCSFCPLKRALKCLEDDGIFPDVCLTNGSESFHVHKVVLGGKSDKFKQLFSNNGNTKNLEIETSYLHYLLTYIYTGAVGDLDRDIALDMLAISLIYNLKDLNNACSEFLENYFTSRSEKDASKSKRKMRHAIFDAITSSFF